MEVRITFMGLFFFSKGTTGGDHMRVIMPVDTHGGAGHVAFIRYKKEYDTLGKGDKLYMQPKSVLAFGKGSALRLELPKTIANISEVLASADRKKLRETNGNGMFRLYGGHVISTQDLYPVTWGSRMNLSIAWRVVWAFQVPGVSNLDFKVTLDTGAVQPVKLQEVDGVIEIDAYYLPAGDKDMIDRPVVLTPAATKNAGHFALHYGLFGLSNTEIPEYTGPNSLHGLGIEPITCLPGGCGDCCPDDNC